jgi:hypothetical protein
VRRSGDVEVAVRGNGFSVALPPGWVDRSVVTLVAPVQDVDGGSPSLVVTRDAVPEGTDARGLARLNHAALKASQAEQLAVIDTERVSVAGLPAVRRTYRWSYGVTGMVQRLWCLVADGAGYTITASAPAHRFDEFAAAFDDAVAGFRLDAPEA